MYLQDLSYEETLVIDGGSVFKYIGAVGMIAFGVYEVSTGIGAVHGVKNIAGGVLAIGSGLIVFLN